MATEPTAGTSCSASANGVAGSALPSVPHAASSSKSSRGIALEEKNAGSALPSVPHAASSSKSSSKSSGKRAAEEKTKKINGRFTETF